MIQTVALVALELGIEQEEASLRTLVGLQRSLLRAFAVDLALTNGQTEEKQKINFQFHDRFLLFVRDPKNLETIETILETF